MSSERPNILLITADQHNADVVGCYGNPVVSTPNIDRLAEKGVRFTQTFTPFPVCSPARSSIMTGLWAHNHGAIHNVNMGKPVRGLDAETPVITGLLKEAGYTTALIGKRHMRMEGVPDMHFDHQVLVEGKCQFTPNNEPDAYRRYLYAKGYGEEWKTWETEEYQRNYWVTSPFPREDYADCFIGRHAVEYLRAVGDGSFFLWVSFCSPHNTWDPPVPYDRLYDPSTIPLPHRRLGELEGKPRRQKDYARKVRPVGPGNTPDLGPSGLSRDSPGWGVFTAPDDPYNRVPEDILRRMLCAYYATVTLVDEQIGRVLGALRSSHKEDNTLVVYTSDHGDYLGHNWLYYKREFLYDSLVRVPLVISWPNHVPEGETSESLASLIDLCPSFLDAARARGEMELDGKSLFAGAVQGSRDFRDAVFSETWGSRMIRTHDWKLIEYPRTEEGELYSLKRDPWEHQNLYSEPRLRQTVDELSERLIQWHSDGPS
jgi:arylsulfatase A-like enzyme